MNLTRRTRPIVRTYTKERLDAMPSMTAAPCQAAQRSENAAIVRKAVVELPHEFRVVVSAFYFDRQSIPTIAARLGIATHTARRRLFRGNTALQAALGAAFDSRFA